jgi:hypothetical protein
MDRLGLANLYFLEARAKLIDLAAFLDRIDRSEGPDDYRVDALRTAVKELSGPGADKTKRVLLSLSDPTLEPIPVAESKGASGAWKAPKP